MRRCPLLLLFALLILRSTPAHSQAAPAFDLVGPKVDVHVKRGEVTLAIGQVPNLLPGDRLWIHPDFPESQSAHFVLIVAFLRGATNPPPADWFTRVDTWTKQAREEGIFITVPAEAQQAILFLAPATGGDFSTLRNAVKGRPGIFVRATQDLQAASQDRMRLDAYLAEVKVTSQTDPKFAERTGPEDSICPGYPGRTAVLRQAHGPAGPLPDATHRGPGDGRRQCLKSRGSVNQRQHGDLMNQLSYSALAGAGVYSPYIGAIVDTARILASLHTAHFQYIPALALPDRRYPEPAPERATLFPRPEVSRSCGIAADRTGEDAAPASGDQRGTVLCAEARACAPKLREHRWFTQPLWRMT